MSGPLRRWASFIFIAASCVLFFYHFRNNVPLLPGVQPTKNTSHKDSKPVPLAPTGPINWTTVPLRYPIESFRPLPSDPPLALPRIQYHFEFSPASNDEQAEGLQRRESVKSAFRRCWQAYQRQAWLLDEVSPITGGFRVSFSGWGATLVDSLDTLYIMDMMDEFNEAVAAVGKIDFSKSADLSINIFETTIRYLGGFLSAYDLSGEPVLLQKATELGHLLYKAFDTPNHMPITRWDWKKAASGAIQVAASSALVSEVGSLSLEFTRLSQLTGDAKWYDAIARITDLFDHQQNDTKLPGMWPVVINPKDEIFTSDSSFTYGGMSDSLYEYMPKEYVLLGGLAPEYRKLYELSTETAIQHLLFRPMVPNNDEIIMSGTVRADPGPESAMLDPQAQHLTCFLGGMLATASKTFNLPFHLDVARKLVNGCIWSYDNAPHGLMPELFHLVPCPTWNNCTWDEELWHKAVLQRVPHPSDMNVSSIIQDRHLPPGFAAITDPRYILRPEAIESIFMSSIASRANDTCSTPPGACLARSRTRPKPNLETLE